MDIDQLSGNIAALLSGALIIFIIILLFRALSWIGYRIRYRNGIPLVLHPLANGAAGTTAEQRAEASPTTPSSGVNPDLLAEVSAYIGEDPPGPLAPGGLQSAAPSTSTEEAQPSSTALAAAFMALTLVRRPGYHVYLNWHDSPDTVSTSAGRGARTANSAGPTGLPGAAADPAANGRETGAAEANRSTFEQLAEPQPRVEVSVSIIRQPGGKLVAACKLDEPRDTIHSAIGSFCIQQVLCQRAVKRRTPRWEQWHSAAAYRDYREGLALRAKGLQLQSEASYLRAQARQAIQDAERLEEAAEGATVRWAETLRARAAQRRADAVAMHNAVVQDWSAPLIRAIDHFRRSSLADPANLLPRLAQATLLEMLDDYTAALHVYVACRNLWPEQIEPAYRLAVYDERRGSGAGAGSSPDGVVADIHRQLRLAHLLRMWLRTWSPRRWAPGERRYWASWLRPSNPRQPRLSLRTKRHEFLVAVAIARLGLRMMVVPDFPNGRHAGTRPRQPAIDLFAMLSRRLGRHYLRGNPVAGLLHPELPRQPQATAPVHKTAWHGNYSLFKRIPHGQAANRIGWLAHYNAACFYSLAIDIPAELRPWDCSEEHWQEDCAAAAIRELGQVLRDPYSQPDPSWLRNDNDLRPLARVLHDLSHRSAGHPLAAWAVHAGLTSRFDNDSMPEPRMAPPHAGEPPAAGEAGPPPPEVPPEANRWAGLTSVVPRIRRPRT